MASIEIDVCDYLDELSDDDVLAEVKHRNLGLGADARLLDRALWYLDRGDIASARAEIETALRDGASDPETAFKLLKLGKHPFLRMPAQ